MSLVIGNDGVGKSILRATEILLQKMDEQVATITELEELGVLMDRYFNKIGSYKAVKQEIEILIQEQKNDREKKLEIEAASLNWDESVAVMDASDISDQEEAEEEIVY